MTRETFTLASMFRPVGSQVEQMAAIQARENAYIAKVAAKQKAEEARQQYNEPQEVKRPAPLPYDNLFPVDPRTPEEIARNLAAYRLRRNIKEAEAEVVRSKAALAYHTNNNVDRHIRLKDMYANAVKKLNSLKLKQGGLRKTRKRKNTRKTRKYSHRR